MRCTFWLLIVLHTSYVYSGLVGDFSQTKNLPGFIDFNTESEVYQGPKITRKNADPGQFPGTPSRILSRFFTGENVDIEKIEFLKEEINRYLANAKIAFCQTQAAAQQISQKYCKTNFPNAELANKWRNKNVNIALKYAITRLQEAIQLSPNVSKENINTTAAVPFLEAFFEALEIYQGVMQDDAQVSDTGIRQILSQALDGFRAKVITNKRMEAANLVRNDGSDILFYSPEELEKLKQQGHDISLMNPLESGFWRKRKMGVSNYDTANYHREEIPYFQKELSEEQIDDLLDAETPIAVSYKIYRPKGTGLTPKIFVKYGHSEFKIKFMTDKFSGRRTLNFIDESIRVLQGMEINIETAVNNLASALGFTVDGTYYKDVVKVFFEDEVYRENRFDEYYQEMLDVLVNQYQQIYNTASALHMVKVDPDTGRKYIQLRHVQLERKYQNHTDLDAGAFIRKGLGKILQREHRAFSLFLAWIWDIDTKDANTSLRMVPVKNSQGDIRYKVVYSNADMGASMGLNRPNFYNFNFIRNYKIDAQGNPTYIRLNYLHAYPNDLLDAVSMADAKWLGRLMAQLTPRQFYRAFRGAGYPDAIAKYYSLLMQKKRNQFLEALNLIGQTFTNDIGEKVTIERLPEFEGTIAGYEEFFENSHLTDPDNRLWDPKREPFPRYWGIGYRNIKGNPQEYLLKLLRLKAFTTLSDYTFRLIGGSANLSLAGFHFREMRFSDTNLAQACAMKCFFQGVNLGVEGFLPWRFIMENPNKNSTSPYLIVELFRLGFFAGYGLQEKFGLAIPGGAVMGIGGKHFQVTEFVKIKPVKDFDDFFRNGNHLLKLPRLTFQSARKQVIENMQEGEILIQSHYVGLRAMARLGLDYGTFFPLSPSLTFSGDMMTVNRVTFAAGRENLLHVGWNKIKQLAARFRLNLVDFIVQIPLLEAEIKKLKTVDRTFQFDRSNSEDMKILFSNINQVVPSMVPVNYSLAQRDITTHSRYYSFGFLNLWRHTSHRRSIDVNFQNFVDDYQGSNLSYVQEINQSKRSRYLGKYTSNYKVQASLTSKKELFAKVKFEGKFKVMTKIKFKNLLYNFDGMLPDNFIQFEPTAVLDNFGDLDMNVETIFPEQSLLDIFKPELTKKEFCKVYSQVHQFNWGHEECEIMSKVRFALSIPFRWRATFEKKYFIQLWRRYEEARQLFWNFKRQRQNSSLSKSYTHKVLKKIVQMMADNHKFDIHSMKVFLRLSHLGNHYHRANMYSKLEAFPGKREFIEQDVTVAGRFTPSEVMKLENPEQEFKLFTDKIHRVVEHLFYDNMYVRFTRANKL